MDLDCNHGYLTLDEVNGLDVCDVLAHASVEVGPGCSKLDRLRQTFIPSAELTQELYPNSLCNFCSDSSECSACSISLSNVMVFMKPLLLSFKGSLSLCPFNLKIP